MRRYMILLTVPFFAHVAWAQEEESLGATKSLEITAKGAEELWKPDEMELPDAETGELKGLMPDKQPTIQEKRISTPKGVVIFSQLWDISCSELCPTKVAVEYPDGKLKILLDDVLPQILPESASKSLAVDDQVTVSEDLKTLSIKTDEGVQKFDLSW